MQAFDTIICKLDLLCSIIVDSLHEFQKNFYYRIKFDNHFVELRFHIFVQYA